MDAFVLFAFFTALFAVAQQSGAVENLLIAPGTLTDTSITFVWDKSGANGAKVNYDVYLDGKIKAKTTRTNITLDGLQPGTAYTISVVVAGSKRQIAKKHFLRFSTKSRSRVFNIIDFGAKGDSSFLNTTAIQAAIDACDKGGTVYIPKGIFISGALFLKSDMTLCISKDAVLKGSARLEDYEPMYLNRFEGWELKTYSSLLNAGTLQRDGSYNVKNLRMTGGGTIAGAGQQLGDAMIKANGLRSRGRLICLMNCQNVDISDLTVREPPCWTIHYIYCKDVTCRNLNINTMGIRNGDGIDPDSSTDSYIFNCTFATGDDCIAIKSGKNPEGYFLRKPTARIRITNCDFARGHGISIGSEMSGGVSDVLVQDCRAAALLHGMQIKGTKDRGGYVRNVTVTDCQLLQITVFSALNYNNDGEAAPEAPVFENFTFRNIDLSKADTKIPVIDINGFKEPGHRLKNITFSNILLPAGARIVINDAEKVDFRSIKTAGGEAPAFIVNNSTAINY